MSVVCLERSFRVHRRASRIGKNRACGRIAAVVATASMRSLLNWGSGDSIYCACCRLGVPVGRVFFLGSMVTLEHSSRLTICVRRILAETVGSHAGYKQTWNRHIESTGEGPAFGPEQNTHVHWALSTYLDRSLVVTLQFPRQLSFYLIIRLIPCNDVCITDCHYFSPLRDLSQIGCCY